MLELAAWAGIGQGKPCGLIFTAFAVIFVSDIVLLIVCVCYVQGIAADTNELLLQSHIATKDFIDRGVKELSRE